MKIRTSGIIEKDGKILTLKYDFENGEVYTLPGGHLEFGENLESALARELEEEIGILVKIGKLRAIAETIHENINTIHFVFDILSFKNTPKINPEETTAHEIVWLSTEEISDILLYPNIDLNAKIVFQGIILQPRV